jgi:hypothetical protein
VDSDSVAVNGYVGYAATDPGPTTVSTAGTTAAGTTHTGTRAIVYSGRAMSDGATASNVLVDVDNVPAVGGMTLSYWIRPLDNQLLSQGRLHDSTADVTLDIQFTDGTTASALGTEVASGADLEANRWNRVFVSLPDAAAGKTVDKVALNFGPTHAFAGSVNAPVSVMTHLVTPTASNNFNANESITSATDGRANTKWLASHVQGEGPWWGMYELDSPQTVSRYVINSANDATDRDPTAWTVEGSNDGQNWTVLDTRSEENFLVRQAEHDYVIPAANRGAYQFYRLNVNTRRGGPWADGGMMQIADWMLYREGDTPSTNNGYARGYIDDLSFNRPIKEIILASANPEIQAGTLFNSTLGTITNTYAASAADLSATIDWGDGSTPTALVATPGPDGFSLSGSHRFAQPAVYPATVTVDDAGVKQSMEINLTVTAPPWFYTPTLNVVGASSAAEQGKTLSYLGTGFKPGEHVTITLATTPQVVVEEMADPAGRVAASIQIPTGARVGSATLTLEGKESGKPVVVTVTVKAAASVDDGKKSEPTQSPTPPIQVTPRPESLPVAVTLVASSAEAVYGASVALDAIVADAAAGGTVTFLDGADAIGSVPVTAGQARLTTNKLTVGKHAVTARYSGDPAYADSASTGLVVTVSKAAPGSVKVALTKAKAGKRTAVVTVSRLNNGQRAKGKVKVYANAKLVKQVKISTAGKARVKLPANAKKVKATFVPSSRTTCIVKSSKTVKVAAR